MTITPIFAKNVVIIHTCIGRCPTFHHTSMFFIEQKFGIVLQKNTHLSKESSDGETKMHYSHQTRTGDAAEYPCKAGVEWSIWSFISARMARIEFECIQVRTVHCSVKIRIVDCGDKQPNRPCQHLPSPSRTTTKMNYHRQSPPIKAHSNKQQKVTPWIFPTL